MTDKPLITPKNTEVLVQEDIFQMAALYNDLKSMLEDRGLDVPIGLDGGIDIATAPLVVEAGATVLVAGSSVYNSKGSVKENVDALLKSV